MILDTGKEALGRGHKAYGACHITHNRGNTIHETQDIGQGAQGRIKRAKVTNHLTQYNGHLVQGRG